MKADVFPLNALKGVVSAIANVVRSLVTAWEFLQNPGIALTAGLVVVAVQTALLPWQWNSFAPSLCLVVMLAVGICYLLPYIKDIEEDEPKPRKLLFWLFLTTWSLPLVWLIYQSRVDFFRFAVSHQTAKITRALLPGNRPLFVVVSDLHVTDRARTLELQPGRGKAAARLLPAIGRLHPQLCIIAGDLTDRGSPAEWQLLDTFLHRAFSLPATLPIRVLLVPGNHDLQGSPGEGLEQKIDSLQSVGDATPQISFAGRAVEFYKVAAEWEGDLPSLLGGKLRNEAFAANWKSLSRDAERVIVRVETNTDQLVDLSHTKSPGTPITNQRPPPKRIFIYPPEFHGELANSSILFSSMFPLRYEDPGIGLEVLLLNSSAEMSPGASMGLGSLGGKQLQALRAELARLQGRRLKYLVAVLHHAPVRRESDQWTWKQAFTRHPGDTDVYAHTYLALDFDDAQDLMGSLGRFAQARPDVQVVVLHGHRHGAFLGRTDQGVLVVEAPAVVESAPGVWVGDETSHGLQISWLPTSTLPDK